MLVTEHSELKNYQDVLFPTVGQWSLRAASLLFLSKTIILLSLNRVYYQYLVS